MDIDQIASIIPNGAEIVVFIVALASLVSAFVPDGKWYGGANGMMARIINYVAFNFGRAKNDPANQ